MKAGQNNSQVSAKSEVPEPVKAPVVEVIPPKPIEQVVQIPNVIEQPIVSEPEDFPEVEDVDENNDEPAVQDEQQKNERILMEIALLQDNGRYRAELLHQLQELNQGITVIASLLADLNEKKR